MRRTRSILMMALAIGVCFFPMSVSALNTAFHGYLESRAIVRDNNGFQYGFLDNTELVQWTQEMQLDLEVKPEYTQGQPQFRFEKAFFRYRGAYDAVLDIRDKYKDIREKSPDDFELGKDDILLENDMRESFLDFVGENAGGDVRANLRLGRQIVQWGEADVFNLINIVNPNEYQSKAFFSNPEDLLNPLWMGRFDITVPGAGIFSGFNMQLLAVPDIRPHVFAPLDGKYNAPYAGGFAGFAPLPVKEDVKASSLDNSEFGARLGTQLGGSSIFLYYYEGYQHGPAIDFSTATQGFFTFRHPKTQTMGYSFNTFIESGNFVLRGEGSMTKGKSFLDFSDATGRGYTEHDFYQVLFGVDKSFSNVPIGTDSAVGTAVQVYYGKVDNWDENPLFGRTTPEDDYRVTFVAYTDYVHGTISPSIFVMWDNAGAWFTSAGVSWSPDGHWYVSLNQASVWGDPHGNSDYTPYIPQSEVALKVGWRW